MKLQIHPSLILLVSLAWTACQNNGQNQVENNQSTQLDSLVKEDNPGLGSTYQWFQNEEYLTGLKDAQGNILVDAQFNCTGNFYNGWAPVSSDNFAGFCDTLGNLESLPYGLKFATAYSELGGGYYFENQSERQYIITNKDQSKFGVVSVEKAIIVSCKYDEVQEFREGLAVVRLDTNYGYIDTNGLEVISLKYRHALSFSEGLAGVKSDSSLFGFINKKDELIIEPKFHNVGEFSGGLCIIFSAESKISFIDKNGNIVIEGPFEDAQPFWGESTLVQKNGKCYYINKKGKKTDDADCDGFLGC